MRDMREELEFKRVEAAVKEYDAVFVFGSNRRGVHGAGAAKVASQRYGALRGVGEGFRGQSYAIPTKGTWDAPALPLAEIAIHVRTFLDFARCHSTRCFAVTRIGCGLAGYTDADIAPLFADAPSNCMLPHGWRVPESVASDISGELFAGEREGGEA